VPNSGREEWLVVQSANHIDFWRLTGVLFLIGLFSASLPAAAQVSALNSYRLGSQDEVELSIPQQPELDRSLTVDDDGNLTLPLIGEVEAAGRGLADLESEILKRIQVFHRDVTRVSLEVSAYNSKAVWVLGAVTNPGKYSAYPVPNVWQAIRGAGGATVDGDLGRVRIYRERDGDQVLETFDLQSMISAEGVLAVPPLAPGETVEVARLPASPGNYVGRDGIYVLGEVTTPGVYRAEPGSDDLLGFILQAGGPLDSAKLGKVLLLRDNADGSLNRMEIDLDRYLDEADVAQNPQVLPGDTIFVPRQRQIGQFLRSNLGILTGIATLVTSIVLLSN
jgi:polysaccharide export outer membrane protein